jgi:hypothetical protein
MRRFFDIPLLWFDKNDHEYFPEYMISVILVLTKENPDPEMVNTYVHHGFDSLASACFPTKEEQARILARDWRV